MSTYNVSLNKKNKRSPKKKRKRKKNRLNYFIEKRTPKNNILKFTFPLEQFLVVLQKIQIGSLLFNKNHPKKLKLLPSYLKFFVLYLDDILYYIYKLKYFLKISIQEQNIFFDTKK